MRTRDVHTGLAEKGCRTWARKVDARLPGKGNSHGARPVHPIITMIKWIWISRMSIKHSLSLQDLGGVEVVIDAFRLRGGSRVLLVLLPLPPTPYLRESERARIYIYIYIYTYIHTHIYI